MMKRMNTKYMQDRRADWGFIEYIIDNMLEEGGEIWLTVFDSSKNDYNYMQVTYLLGAYKEQAIHYIQTVLSDTWKELTGLKNFYLIEYREYAGEKFTHYRAFYNDLDTIKRFFRQYMNDEKVDVSSWLDVTDEFTKE